MSLESEGPTLFTEKKQEVKKALEEAVVLNDLIMKVDELTKKYSDSPEIKNGLAEIKRRAEQANQENDILFEDEDAKIVQTILLEVDDIFDPQAAWKKRLDMANDNLSIILKGDLSKLNPETINKLKKLEESGKALKDQLKNIPFNLLMPQIEEILNFLPPLNVSKEAKIMASILEEQLVDIEGVKAEIFSPLLEGNGDPDKIVQTTIKKLKDNPSLFQDDVCTYSPDGKIQINAYLHPPVDQNKPNERKILLVVSHMEENQERTVLTSMEGETDFPLKKAYEDLHELVKKEKKDKQQAV